MIKADELMRTARTDSSELGQQFIIPRPRENFWGKGRALDKERTICEFNEEKWKQLPGLIIIGNGTYWALMISLDLEVISEYIYRFKKMLIQTELLDLLQDLPVCVGLGVKGDVHEIEQFHSKVSGMNLEMAGFSDLSALALVASYQMSPREMITVSLVEGDPGKELEKEEPEKEDPVEPEPVPDVEL